MPGTRKNSKELKYQAKHRAPILDTPPVRFCLYIFIVNMPLKMAFKDMKATTNRNEGKLYMHKHVKLHGFAAVIR